MRADDHWARENEKFDKTVKKGVAAVIFVALFWMAVVACVIGTGIYLALKNWG